ncbi:MAG: hypothetical protein NNC22_01590, partial [Candidatus Nanosynbacter sp. P5B_S4_bin.39.1]|nr:hypothetical protein [Candidatus Nanosynbacter sp. P5B_S4_bin.39.1]
AIAGILGLGGGILGIFISPATMLQNIMESLTWKNDSATPAKISRIKQAMNGFLDSKDSPGICANSSKKIRCRTGKLSYKALTKFKKSGIIPVDADGNEMKLKKTGYPEKKPTHWKVEGLNDGKPIESSKLKDELLKKENRKIASKVYGRTGLFKMRFHAWTGKHISKLYDKFNLKRNSAISKIDKKLGVKERANKLKEKLPGFNDDKAIGGINERVTKSTEKLKKGGLVYVAAAGICLALKLPNIIASGVAAIQLVPLLGLVMDVILSPGSQAKASGLDSNGSGFSQETMETIGTMLTERGKMKGSDNAEGSALDSPYLLAAMGVNNDKPGIAKNYIPGYSVATNPIVRTLNSAEEASEPVCNYILSPVAMYSSQAVDLAIDATGAATFGLTSLAKWIAKKTLATVTTELLKYAVGDTVKRVLKELAVSMLTSNNAQYKDLGDALGVGAAAFFASGSMG